MSLASLLACVAIAGVVLIVANEYAATSGGAKQVEYRYLPRDLDEYLRTAPQASTVFGAMFDERDVI